MAQICPACKSDDVQTMVRSIHCLACGKYTSYAELNRTPQPTHRKG